MTLYIGVDIHARQQTVSFLDTADGTTGQVELEHEGDDVKRFYGQFHGEVIIGIEACGYTNWFEELMEQLGNQLLVGDAAEIRRLAWPTRFAGQVDLFCGRVRILLHERRAARIDGCCPCGVTATVR